MQVGSHDLQWRYNKQKITILNNPYCIIIDNLFGAERSNKIFEHIISLKDHFQPAEIMYEGSLKVNETYRKNLTCYVDSLYKNNEQEWSRRREYRRRSPLLEAVDGLMESIDMGTILNSAPIPMCKFKDVNVWESQISRYGYEGEHYEWHYDRISNDDRLITLVYYVNMEPRKFHGGQLLLSDGFLLDRQIITPDSKEHTIEPENDRLVIFNSRTIHKVAATTSSSKFEEGRFSVNIWCGIRQNGATVSNY